MVFIPFQSTRFLVLFFLHKHVIMFPQILPCYIVCVLQPCMP